MHVRILIKQYTRWFSTVTARSTRLLEISFNWFRKRVMKHETHVWFIDSHTKRDGRAHDLESMRNWSKIRIIKRMKGYTVNSGCLKNFCVMADLRSILYIIFILNFFNVEEILLSTQVRGREKLKSHSFPFDKKTCPAGRHQNNKKTDAKIDT